MPADHDHITISIDKYAVFHTACGTHVAINYIVCFSGGSEVGQIQFYPIGKSIQSKVYISSSGGVGYFWIICEINRYQDIIETLRYEKTIYIHLDWDINYNISWGTVSTSQEPISEQEGVPVPT